MKKRHVVVISLGLVAGSFVGLGLYRQMTHQMQAVEAGPIYQYQQERDHDDIITLFELERSWLTVSDYDPVFMLKYMAPYKGVQHKDGLFVWVARENGIFTGFTACYWEHPGQGKILFLATRPEFRGRGYGKKLARHALDEFQKRGAQSVTLVTRTTNIPARRVYDQLGFTEIAQDQGEAGHVYYRYTF